MSTFRSSDAGGGLEIYLTSANVSGINESHRSSHKYVASFLRTSNSNDLHDILHANGKAANSQKISQNSMNFVHLIIMPSPSIYKRIFELIKIGAIIAGVSSS